MPEKDVRSIVKKEIEELLAMLSEKEGGEAGGGEPVIARLPVRREEGEPARPEAGRQPGQPVPAAAGAQQPGQRPGRAPSPQLLPQHLREIWDRLPPETRAVLELLMWEGPGGEPGTGQQKGAKYRETVEALKALAPGADISLKAIIMADEVLRKIEGPSEEQRREAGEAAGETALQELLPPGFLRELAAAAKQLAQRPGRLPQGPQPGRQQGLAQPSRAAQGAGQQPLAPVGAQQPLGAQPSPQQPGQAPSTAQHRAAGEQQPGQPTWAPGPGQVWQGMQQRQTPMPRQPGAGRQEAQRAGQQPRQQQGMPSPPMPRAPRMERPLEELAREVAEKLPPEQRALLELFAEKPLAQPIGAGKRGAKQPAHRTPMPGAEQRAGQQPLQPRAAQQPGMPQQGTQQPYPQQVPAGVPGAQAPMPPGAQLPGRQGQAPIPGQQQQSSAQPGPAHQQQPAARPSMPQASPQAAQPHIPPPPPLYQPRTPSLEEYLKGGEKKPQAQQPRIPESPEERKKLAEALLRQYAKQLEEALGLRITMRLWVREREEKRTRKRKKQPA